MNQAQSARWESRAQVVSPPTTFPLVPGTKKPAGKWSRLKPGEQIPGDEQTISYGVALGSRSGGLLVIDVDSKADAPGFSSLEALETRYPLPDTFSVRTPSGGLHLYYWHPDPIGSQNGWYPGIDVKAEGGYVVIPGSIDPRGTYTIEDDHPIARLPDTWAAQMPRASSGPRAPSGPSKTQDPHDIRLLLAETVKRRRGPVWDAWRKVLQGILPFDHRTAQDVAGGVDSFVRLGMFVRLAHASEDWASVSGEAIAELMTPSMSRFALECERIGTETKWTDPAHIALKWDAARAIAQDHQAEAKENVKAVSQFLAQQTEAHDSGLPWIVTRDGTWYVLMPKEDPPTYWPALRSATSVLCVARRAWACCSGAPALEVPTRSGSRAATPAELVEHGSGLEVQTVYRDYTIQEPKIVDHDLHLPAARVLVSAREHKDVHAWLRALGGSWLLDWIACVPRLEQASPALWIMGRASIGKTVLAHGLSRIWRPVAQPVQGSKAFARFNAELAECPLVLADEKVPENFRGFTDIDTLKDLITSTTHTIEQKNLPTQTLKGALRVILASNDLNAIRNMGRIDRHNVEALGQRFVFVDASETAPRPRDFASADRIQMGWLDQGAIAEHAIYLSEIRRVLPGERLIMRSNAAEMVHALMVQPDGHGQILRAISTLLIRLARAKEGGTRTPKICYMDGLIYVTTTPIRNAIQESQERAPTLSAIGRILNTLSDAPRKSIHVPGVGPRRFRPVSPELLLRWAEEDGQPSELQAALTVLKERIRVESNGAIS